MRTPRLVYWAPAQNQSVQFTGELEKKIPQVAGSPPTTDVGTLIETGKSEASDAFECIIATDGLPQDIATGNVPTGEYGHYRCSSTLVQILISFFTSMIDDEDRSSTVGKKQQKGQEQRQHAFLRVILLVRPSLDHIYRHIWDHF